VIVIP